MTTTLYALTGDALRISQQIDEAATDLFSDDPAVVAAATATLEGLISAEADNKQAILAKADAWCWVIDSLRARHAARKARADALRELADADERQADALQDRLIQALQKVDPEATKYDLPEHKLASRKSTVVLVDCEPEDLPKLYQRTKIEANKTAIKESINAALVAAVKAAPDEEAKAKAYATALVETVPGCSLVERRSWSIK
jgi:anion-transporting  ArsA/GET3 family ATPase